MNKNYLYFIVLHTMYLCSARIIIIFFPILFFFYAQKIIFNIYICVLFILKIYIILISYFMGQIKISVFIYKELLCLTKIIFFIEF